MSERVLIEMPKSIQEKTLEALERIEKLMQDFLASTGGRVVAQVQDEVQIELPTPFKQGKANGGTAKRRA